MLKNKLLTILFMIILMIPVWAEEPVPSDFFRQEAEENVEEIQLTDGDIQNEPAELEEITTNNIYKQPVSKKKIAKKFLMAMSGVAISSIALFLILSLYNKVRDSLTAPIVTQTTSKELDTPDTLQDAVTVFLSKTKWDEL